MTARTASKRRGRAKLAALVVVLGCWGGGWMIDTLTAQHAPTPADVVVPVVMDTPPPVVVHIPQPCQPGQIHGQPVSICPTAPPATSSGSGGKQHGLIGWFSH
jgi:hypothetical protein